MARAVVNPHQRRCPYCASQINLATAQIVSRRQAPIGTGAAGGQRDVGAVASDDFSDAPVSATEPGLSPGGYKVLRPRAALVDAQQRLVPLLEIFDQRELPARVCPVCHYTLPIDLDTRQMHTIAVVGSTGVGKTHYLAEALHEAVQGDLLSQWGFHRFRPDEATSERIVAEYRSTVRSNQVFRPNQLEYDSDVMYRPLVFRTERPTTKMMGFKREDVPWSILVHDMPGEMIQVADNRHTLAPFLRHVDGIILLIDPWGFPRIGDVMRQRHPELDPGDMSYRQAALINGLADDLGDRARTVPVAVTLTKSDLISDLIPGKYAFTQPYPQTQGEHAAQLGDIGDDVFKLLRGELYDGHLSESIGAFGNQQLCAVAAIGTQPGINGAITAHRPSRCIDPLASVLSRISG